MKRLKLIKSWLLIAMTLLSFHHFALGQNVTYGFIQGASNPLEITAVAYPDFNSNNTTISTAVFSFLLPAGTVTDPAVPAAPSTGAFNNITGNWDAQLVNAANYTGQGGDPADLLGNDVYQVVLQNSPLLTDVENGVPVELFSFTLPDDCMGGNVEVLTNDGAIQQAVLSTLFSNFNNQMSLSIEGSSTSDRYAGNDPASASLSCPLSSDAPDAVSDSYTVPENTTASLDPLSNDDFGPDGPSTQAITIETPPSNGVAVVDDNGTPSDPTDDTVDYTPDASYTGTDQFVYEICDANGDCDQAAASITVSSEGPCSPDATPPSLTVSDASGAIPQGVQSLVPPEGACAVERTWLVMAMDNCTSPPAVTADITNNNLGVFPTAELTELSNGASYALEIHAAIGTNTITVTATDEAGNTTTQTFEITVEDQRVPEIYGPDNMLVEIPSCQADIPVNWTVSAVDDCDIQPTLTQTAGPDPGTSLAPGTYSVAYSSTDDWGNTADYSFDIEVVQAPSPAPIVDLSGNGQFNVPACEAGAAVVFSGNVYDCDLTSFNFDPADLTVTTTPLSPNASGAVEISYTLPQEGFVYFEATGGLAPGSYLIVVDYDGVTVDHAVTVTQDPDQPAAITMPGNLSFLAGACQPGADLSFEVQLSDDCDTDLSGATFTLNGAAAPAIDTAASDPAAGRYVWNLEDIPGGLYTLEASYTDGAGNVSTAEATFTVTAQPDEWAPIVVYPSQQINEEIDACSPATSQNVFFEVTATDNCGNATLTVEADGEELATVVGNTYVASVDANTCVTVGITAEDDAGNVRNEDFQICVDKDPAPAAALACNDLVNITLDEDCQRVVTADMVLEGSFGCFEDDDFVVEIGEGLDTYGNVLPGPGQFFYEVTFEPSSSNFSGFTGPFAPTEWAVETNGGDSDVNFTSTTLTLLSGADDGASAAISLPADGTLSFDYEYALESEIIADAFIVDINGTVVEELEFDGMGSTATGNGSISEQVEAGWMLVFELDGDGFATSGVISEVIISNFLLTAAEGDDAGPIDFEPCWGEILGEDKSSAELICPPSTGTGTVVKDGFAISGELDVNDPQVILENYSCLIDNTQPDFPGTRYVDTEVFQVSEDDVYTFLVTSDVTDFGNVGFAIYQGSFDIDNPCENIIGQSDIPQPPGSGNPLPGAQGNDPFVRLALPLEAGETYILATTSFTPDAVGTYEYAICADDEGEVGLFDTTIVTNPDWTMDTIMSLVPFPTNPITIELPLYCGDVDALTVSTLGADVPRCYTTDGDGNVILPDDPQERALLLELFDRLESTGFPGTLQGAGGGGSMDDPCGSILAVCVSDEVIADGDCGGITIRRTFTLTDGGGMETVCVQELSLKTVDSITDVWLPPFTAPVECDEDFATLPNGNPSPAATGYPFVYTVGGIIDLDDDYCNIGATFEDGAPIEICEGAYKFVRTWTIVDWCFPTDLYTYPQIVKVGDFTAPEVSCPDNIGNPGQAGDLGYPVFSTSPYSCTASFEVPLPDVTDNCSSFSVLTDIVTEVEVEVTNPYGQVVGTELDTVVVATIPDGSSRTVSGIPVGLHFFRYTVVDECGNRDVIYCRCEVTDLIQPVAICDDQLNVSLGGGLGSVGLDEVRARVYAEDFDEGSWDNCGPVTLEVRRNKFDFFNYTCGDGLGVTNPILFDGWGPYVDFFCCDVGEEIEIELRVTDAAGNQNICWLVVTPEEKAKPYCFAPQNTMIDCDELPYGFHPQDVDQLQDLFGVATAEDNCGAITEELTPITNQLDDCGFGTLIRRFRAVDDMGNVSMNTCQQIITIKEVHNYEIKFPMDVSLECNEVPDTAELEINEIGCDLIAVSQEDHVFSASADECYKIFRTFKVINWCQYDGESDPVVIARDSDCNGTAGDNMFWLLARPNGYVYLDADNDETPGNNVPGLNFCNFEIRDFYQKFQDNTGYYEYTQHIRVYDDVKPEIDFEEADPFCSYDNTDCTANVSVDFSVFDNCTPDDLEVKVFLDAFADGIIDGELTGDLGASFEFELTGSYPDYTISGVFPIGEHIFEIHVVDGCGNSALGEIEFSVIDCKAPAPICINGISLELMPIDTTGDNDPDTGMAEVWVSDYLASPLTDCTGPVKYSINFAGEPNDPDQDVLFFDCSHIGTQVIEIWAYDGAGNSDFCETYVIVQDNMNVCPTVGGASMAGAVNTEQQEAVSDVEVSLSGQTSSSMTTGTDGAYSFEGLEAGMDYTVTPQRDGDYLNGVSTFDLVLISKHILGVTPLSSPYQMIAADVNNSGNISTLDLIQLRKLILSIDTELSNNTSWRFVDEAYQFPNPANPWLEDFPEVINQNNLPETDISDADFVAVKIGDVDGSAQANSLAAVENRSFEGTFAFNVAEAELKAGNEYTVAFTAADLARIEGYQATLTLDGAVEVVDIIAGVAGEEHFGMVYADKGMITTSWHQDGSRKAESGSRKWESGSRKWESGSRKSVFSLVLRANADAMLSEVLGVSSELTKAEAYGKGGSLQDVAIEFTNGTVGGAAFELYQNQPNPFKGETMIGFNLPQAADATITINDVTGKVLTVMHHDGVKGYNSIVVDAKDLPTAGVLTYTVKTGEYAATKKMVISK